MKYLQIKYSLYAFFFRAFASKSFKTFGKKTNVIFPLRIDGCKNIILGNNVTIAYKTWLAALPLTNEKSCTLEIRSGTIIGHFNHIYSTNEIIIEENVLTADKVYISDNSHHYEDINLPVLHQGIKQLNKVTIGSGTWIGENVCIIGCKIGKNCVIGANSVVTKDIPDYCIVVGTPAKIIKRFCFKYNTWKKTDINDKL